MEKNYFEELNNIDVSSLIEKKGGLNYLSWAHAWGALKKKYPYAQYKIWENSDGLPYFKSEEGYACKVTVYIPVGEMLVLDHTEWLPVLDFKNQPIKQADMFQINKTIKRALVKAIAMHGLGLGVYAGEDLPNGDSATTQKPSQKAPEGTSNQKIQAERQVGATMLKELSKGDPGKMEDIVYELSKYVNKKDGKEYGRKLIEDLSDAWWAVFYPKLEDLYKARN